MDKVKRKKGKGTSNNEDEKQRGREKSELRSADRLGLIPFEVVDAQMIDTVTPDDVVSRNRAVDLESRVKPEQNQCGMATLV